MDETEYTELYMELEKYEKRGIDMLLDGYQASPLQIVTAHMKVKTYFDTKCTRHCPFIKRFTFL